MSLGLASLAQAQSARVPVLGLAHVGDRNCNPGPNWAGFLDGLRELGRVVGKNVTLAVECYRSAAELQQAVRKLVDRKVDVMLTGAPATAREIMKATSTIPIVCISCGDPVATGLAISLARPGRNLTGMASLSAELVGKRLELLKEMVPGLTRVAALINPENPGTSPTLKAFDRFGPELKLDILRFEFRKIEDIAAAMRAAAAVRPGAVLIQDDPYVFVGRVEVAEQALKNKLVTSLGMPENAEAGALFAYGPNRIALGKRAARYVDQVLNGAKPGDLAIEQAATFDMVINLKTARALGLTIPRSLLLQATQVIE